MKFSYEQAMEYLNGLPLFSPAAVAKGEQKINLDAIRELLKRLGSPEKNLKYIHVAGTNGKGSTCAFLRHILTESGIKTGSFTSPVLKSFEEQIRVDGQEIKKEDVGRLMYTVKVEAENMCLEGYPAPSQFEQVLALALLYFNRQECELVILETGMGGTMDATNVIPVPELAVITTISYDHMQVLGNTLEEIAEQKAGIIKEKGAVLVTAQKSGVMRILEERCRQKRAALTVARIPQKTGGNLKGQQFSLDGLGEFQIPFAADYQIQNAALAIEAALFLRKRGYPVSMDTIKSGLCRTRWKGRFEIIQENPVLVVDGGHNVQGAEVLAGNLRRLFPGKNIYFVVGVLADKQYTQMMEQLFPLAGKFYSVTPPSARALDKEILAEYLRTKGAVAEAAESVSSAISEAVQAAGKEGVVCVCGSLSFLAQAEKYLKTKGKNNESSFI